MIIRSLVTRCESDVDYQCFTIYIENIYIFFWLLHGSIENCSVFSVFSISRFNLKLFRFNKCQKFNTYLIHFILATRNYDTTKIHLLIWREIGFE